jgi:hypothetical protein
MPCGTPREWLAQKPTDARYRDAYLRKRTAQAALQDNERLTDEIPRCHRVVDRGPRLRGEEE